MSKQSWVESSNNGVDPRKGMNYWEKNDMHLYVKKEYK